MLKKPVVFITATAKNTSQVKDYMFMKRAMKLTFIYRHDTGDEATER